MCLTCRTLSSLVEAVTQSKSQKMTLSEYESCLSQWKGTEHEVGNEQLTSMKSQLRQHEEYIDTLFEKLLRDGDNEDWPFGRTISTPGSDGKQQQQTVVTSPKGLKGIIKATMLEIETLKKRQLAILASPNSLVSSHSDTNLPIAAADSSQMLPISSPVSKKRKAGNLGSNTADGMDAITSDVGSPNAEHTNNATQRLREIQISLLLLQDELHKVQNQVSQWSKEAVEKVDQQLSDLRSTREDALKRAKAKEEERLRLVENLEKVAAEKREEVRKAISASEKLDQENADLEAQHNAFMRRADKVR